MVLHMNEGHQGRFDGFNLSSFLRVGSIRQSTKDTLQQPSSLYSLTYKFVGCMCNVIGQIQNLYWGK